MPKSNRKFWETKLARNQERDIRVVRELSELSWVALRVWEHELRGDSRTVVQRIMRLLKRRGAPQHRIKRL